MVSFALLYGLQRPRSSLIHSFKYVLGHQGYRLDNATVAAGSASLPNPLLPNGHFLVSVLSYLPLRDQLSLRGPQHLSLLLAVRKLPGAVPKLFGLWNTAHRSSPDHSLCSRGNS